MYKLPGPSMFIGFGVWGCNWVKVCGGRVMGRSIFVTVPLLGSATLNIIVLPSCSFSRSTPSGSFDFAFCSQNGFVYPRHFFNTKLDRGCLPMEVLFLNQLKWAMQ